MADLTGHLSQGAIPDVLRQVYVGRWTGTLHFDNGGRRRSIRFRRGHIINAVTSIPEDHLGETMVRHGLITTENLERATEMVRSQGSRLGEALQELGAIDVSTLEDGIALHVRDILLRVFEWSDGTWSFENEPDEASINAPVLKLSAGELTLEAVRRIDDADVIRYQLGDLDRILALSSDPLLRFQKLALTPTDGFVLSRVDGNYSAREVIQMIPLPPEQTQRSLFGLICTGVVECLAPPERKKAPALGASSERPRREEPPKAPVPGPPAPSSREARDAPTPSAVPAVLPTVPTPDPQRETATGPATAGGAPANPEAVARRKEVIEAFEGLRLRDHFEILGLAESAPEAQIKESYFRLAKRFHPDSHHDPSLADLHDQIEAVFIRLGEAYEVLRNPRMRAAYEEALRARRPDPPSPSTEAPSPAGAGPRGSRTVSESSAGARETEEDWARRGQEAVLRASAFFEGGQYWDAIQVLEPMIPRLEGRVRSRGRVLLARCLLKNPHWVRRGEEMLLAVTHEDPKYAEAWFSLATIYRDRGLKARAASMFRKVVDLKPDHEEAQKALAEIEPPPAVAPPESGGLMKRLFRKA